MPLLALLKHPLAAGGHDARGIRARLARRLEGAVLRGPRPAPGFAGLREAVRAGDEHGRICRLVDRLAQLARPLDEFAAKRLERRCRR